MKENNQNKRFLWIYAALLFSSVFLALLVTAYSQQKYVNNIEEYKMKISEQEKARLGVETNWYNAIQENEKLKEEINSVKAENDSLKKELDNIKQELSERQKSTEQFGTAYDKLIKATSLYDEGRIVECAELLAQIDYKVLSAAGREKYMQLVSSTTGQAAELLYFDGLEYYQNGEYARAIDCFDRSEKLAGDDKYYSDDALYLKACAYGSMGDIQKGKAVIEELKKKYPSSGYIVHAEWLLEEWSR